MSDVVERLKRHALAFEHGQRHPVDLQIAIREAINYIAELEARLAEARSILSRSVRVEQTGGQGGMRLKP